MNTHGWGWSWHFFLPQQWTTLSSIWVHSWSTQTSVCSKDVVSVFKSLVQAQLHSPDSSRMGLKFLQANLIKNYLHRQYLYMIKGYKRLKITSSFPVPSPPSFRGGSFYPSVALLTTEAYDNTNSLHLVFCTEL